MGDLDSFAKRVGEKITVSSREPRWEPVQVERFMEAVNARRIEFEQHNQRLIESVIQPRLETVTGHFVNARISNDERRGRCAAWFGYCERFPANTEVSFTVEHDIRFENLVVQYDVAMMPLFIKFNDRDRFAQPLGAIDDNAVARWVEERIFEFLDAYFRIDRGEAEFVEDAAVDPICGMRISRSQAYSCESYRGHPYFFCSRECSERFRREPSAFVDVRTL